MRQLVKVRDKVNDRIVYVDPDDWFGRGEWMWGQISPTDENGWSFQRCDLEEVQEESTRKLLDTVTKAIYGGKIHIIPATEVKVGTVINTPAGFKTVATIEPDDERGGQLIYYRCTDNSLWCADLDKEVEIKAPTVEAKAPAPNLAPGEIHVPRDFEKKRGRLAPRSRTIELSRLAPPSERPAQLGDRVRMPGSKRAIVIRDPAVDKVARMIQGFLGDTEGGSESENCWTLAIDAAHEAGYVDDSAIRIAKAACRQLGYPQR